MISSPESTGFKPWFMCEPKFQNGSDLQGMESRKEKRSMVKKYQDLADNLESNIKAV